MNKIWRYGLTPIMMVLLALSVKQAFSQDDMVDRLSVPFTDPGKPGFIDVGLINGGISINGYDGKDVIVEASTKTRKISDNESGEKGRGMIRIPVTTTGLSVEEENNRMEINVESWKRTIDLNIRVPFKTSMKLSCVNQGDIYVENITGEIEVNNINGKVTLIDISGAVVAHALNKTLVVTMKKVDSDKNMSFSTLNGDVDVTFPGSFKANVKMSSDNGDIYSDFEIKMESKPRRIMEDNDRKHGGKYRVQIDHLVYGTINGGGPEVVFKSFNGDIFIRKSK
jgi:hypothetical protein